MASNTKPNFKKIFVIGLNFVIHIFNQCTCVIVIKIKNKSTKFSS